VSAPRAGAPLRLGASACLLGERVRWNGDHERRSFLADVLAPHVEWVRVCPEIEGGLGVPREPIAFVRGADGLALYGARSRRDLTRTMDAVSAARVDALAAAPLDGYVLVRNSPSCGLSGARVYATLDDLAADGPFERAARGIFAAALARRFPQLPIVEDADLETRAGQEHFVERCFAMRRARERLGEAGDLADFHDRHDLQILARSAEARRSLGRLAGEEREARRDDVAAAYLAGFAAAMSRPPSRDRLAGVLRRVESRLIARLPASERGEIADAIAAFEAEGAELDDVREVLLEAAVSSADEALVRQSFLAVEPEERAIRAAIRAA
jgi:uncharacterized protein YbbK (DUF523 family)/uncharacterized protein YbgA (DUF1722 family)